MITSSSCLRWRGKPEHLVRDHLSDSLHKVVSLSLHICLEDELATSKRTTAHKQQTIQISGCSTNPRHNYESVDSFNCSVDFMCTLFPSKKIKDFYYFLVVLECRDVCSS